MDPIAVDVSVKSPLSLGLGSRPITTLNGSSSARPEAKPEPAKPPFTAPTPATVAPTTLPGKIANTLGFQPTRKNGLVLAAAACSLVVGIAAVRYLAPTRPAEGTQALVADSTKEKEKPPKPVEPPESVETPKPPETRRPAAVVEDPNPPGSSGAFIPSAFPTAPLAPTMPPTSVVPSTTPSFGVSPEPISTAVIPTKLPSIPATVIPASLPSVPTIPSAPSSTDGFVTAGTSKTSGTPFIPLPVDLVSPTIPVPSLFPVSASEPVIPSTAPPSAPAVLPTVPTTSPSTLPTIPSMVPSAPPVVVTPPLPATPAIPPTTPVVITPMMPLTAVIPPTAPATFVLPPSPFPSTTPPAAEPSKPLTIEYSKPIGSPDVKPAVPDRVATTSYDVDLHEPKNGDTYSSIAKEYYNDVKYAGALQEHNGRRALQTNVRLEVPPIHVLKKRYPQLIGAVVPASGKTGDVWGPSGDAAVPAFRSSGQRTFTVPTGGMTMGSIARDTLGSPNRWHDIYDLNPSLAPGDVLPAGTVVKIPSDVKPNN